MNPNAPMRSYIIQCRTLCKIPEVNWLKIGGVLEVSERTTSFLFLFFSLRRPGTNSKGVYNYHSVNAVLQDQTALEGIQGTVLNRPTKEVEHLHLCKFLFLFFYKIYLQLFLVLVSLFMEWCHDLDIFGHDISIFQFLTWCHQKG